MPVFLMLACRLQREAPFGGTQTESASPTDQACGSVPPNCVHNDGACLAVWSVPTRDAQHHRENGRCQDSRVKTERGKRIKNLQ